PGRVHPRGPTRSLTAGTGATPERGPVPAPPRLGPRPGPGRRLRGRIRAGAVPAGAVSTRRVAALRRPVPPPVLTRVAGGVAAALPAVAGRRPPGLRPPARRLTPLHRIVVDGAVPPTGRSSPD